MYACYKKFFALRYQIGCMLRSLLPSMICIFICSLNAEIPSSSLSKWPPMEKVYHPVSTQNLEAQESFDRGLTYIYAFNHDAAFAAFENAARKDPLLAMAYWGMALALGQNINQDVTPASEIRSYDYIQQALRLSNTASSNEKAYIEALATRYTRNPTADLNALRYRYREAMKQVVVSYPEDLDAATLYAESILDLDPWKWWTNEGKPLEGVLEAIAHLEFVLKRNPLHLGANHYYVHALEESPEPEKALMSAHRLQSLLPEGGHILHMPCHIFLIVGDYESCLKTSQKAIAQDKAYFKEYGLSRGIYPLHYLSHNLAVLARIYMLMEDYEHAIKVALEVADFVQPHLGAMPHFAHFTKVPLEIYLYFHKWKEILAYQLQVGPASGLPDTQAHWKAYWHFCRAQGFAHLADLTAARHEQELMMDYKKQIDEPEKIKIIELAQTDLEATFARIEKRYPEYITLLNKTVELQDQLNYDEPPEWYLSQRIVLGAALLEQQRYKEAEALFLKTLDRLQRNGRALFGLLLSLKGQNRTIDAYWIEREMTAALQHASKPLKLEDL